MKLLLLLICVTLNQSFAADDKGIEETGGHTPEKHLASAANREKVKYQINLNAIGSEYSAPAIGLGLGYHLNPDDLLLLRYSNYNGDATIKKLRAVTLGYRKFEGNSFNIMPSVYYRESTTNYLSIDPVWFEIKDYVVCDMGIGFRIGNEWQWQHFMLGVDWIGINRTISRFSETKATGIVGNVYSTYTVTVLSLYFGYSF